MERTEEEKIVRVPIKVVLGGKEYEIRPLVILYSGEWRKKALPLADFLLRYARMTSEEQEKAFIELFTTKVDEIIDCFFEYARDLNKEEIKSTTTDIEIIFAFMEVFNAFVAPLSVVPLKKAEIKPTQ